ncbi:GTP-binding protein [Vallitalea pronyensis]|uniref:GTP-binding protein n=1 Tax=Vallitalea pronyensis TaxID=1348613 RepID=A0A8J8SG37_9FIRM|nr:GTP-binding protein [Vallitalea pronyensis]QUI22345.1 GTP-binding protein [Vallitalea pronyensis]
MTKVYLITGFLGSGKTTFLQNQLKSNTHKTGVLMNEFGKTSIDGTLIQDDNMDMIELTNGSIFCSCLKDHFIEGLRELISKELDCIYIESSGLADPSNMLTIMALLKSQCSQEFSYEGSICIIDCLHFLKEYEMMVSVANQVRHSQTIILNKTDLIDEATKDKIRKIIVELNHQAKLIETTYGQVDATELNIGHAFSQQPGETSNTESNRPRTLTLMFNQENVKIEDVMQLFEQIKPFCHRIKGLLSLDHITYKIDGVQDHLKVCEYNDPSEDNNKIVLISNVGTKLITRIQEMMPDALKGQVDIKME